jgi:hypothetical protein
MKPAARIVIVLELVAVLLSGAGCQTFRASHTEDDLVRDEQVGAVVDQAASIVYCIAQVLQSVAW